MAYNPLTIDSALPRTLDLNLVFPPQGYPLATDQNFQIKLPALPIEEAGFTRGKLTLYLTSGGLPVIVPERDGRVGYPLNLRLQTLVSAHSLALWTGGEYAEFNGRFIPSTRNAEHSFQTHTVGALRDRAIGLNLILRPGRAAQEAIPARLAYSQDYRGGTQTVTMDFRYGETPLRPTAVALSEKHGKNSYNFTTTTKVSSREALSRFGVDLTYQGQSLSRTIDATTTVENLVRAWRTRRVRNLLDHLAFIEADL